MQDPPSPAVVTCSLANRDRFFNMIPHLNEHGIELTHEERATIADKLGICVYCGVKTHTGSVFSRALTNDNVHNGICIKCHPALEVPTVHGPGRKKPKSFPSRTTEGRFDSVRGSGNNRKLRHERALKGSPNWLPVTRELCPSHQKKLY